MLKQKFLLLLVTAFSLAACSRYADKKPLADALPVTVGPSNKDVKVDFTLPKNLQIMDTGLAQQGEMNTAEYFRLVDDLKALSAIDNNEKLGELAKEMYGAFYKDSSAYTKNSFSRFYMESILGAAQPEAQAQLTIIARDLSVTKQKLTVLLDDSAATYPWPKEITHLNQAVQSADNYVTWLMKAIPRLNLTPELQKPVTAAIRKEYGKYRPGFAKMADSLENAQNFAQAVRAVKTALATLKVKLPEQQASLIGKADAMVKSLATMETSQDALALLIDVWRLVPVANREQVFKPVVPELYDYLSDKSETSLDCLAASFCLNPVLEVAKRVGILPKLTEFGVRKIHDQIEAAAKDFLIKEVRLQAAKLISQIPIEARKNIVVEAEKYQALIAGIQSDFPGFARPRAAKWGAQNFSDELRGLEVDKVSVKLGGRGKFAVKPLVAATEKVNSGAETMGLSLALSHEFLPESNTSRIRPALVEPLLKLLAIGGFPQLNGKAFPSLLLAMDGKPTELFKVDELLKGDTSFLVPDSFSASSDFFMDRANAKHNSSVGAQAELLRGIARQVKFHRDWEQNVFDEKLSVVKAEELAPEIPDGAVDLSIFPKDLIFSLAVADAASILQNIVRPSSPAFLLLPDGQLLWGDKYKEISVDKVSTIAGLVSIENGVRGKTVRTAEVARYILALSEFLDATEGVEQTKAAPLLKLIPDPDDENKTTRIVDQLAKARTYLRLLQMGLTNFLVSVAQQKDGAVNGQFSLETGKLQRVDSPLSLEDHVLTIRALNASAKSLDLPIFRWAALDAYYYLNKKFWDRRTQFYSAALTANGANGRAVNLRELTLTLLSINELAPHMNMESRAQWDQISKKWMRALEDF